MPTVICVGLSNTIQPADICPGVCPTHILRISFVEQRFPINQVSNQSHVEQTGGTCECHQEGYG